MLAREISLDANASLSLARREQSTGVQPTGMRGADQPSFMADGAGETYGKLHDK